MNSKNPEERGTEMKGVVKLVLAAMEQLVCTQCKMLLKHRDAVVITVTDETVGETLCEVCAHRRGN